MTGSTKGEKKLFKNVLPRFFVLTTENNNLAKNNPVKRYT